MTERVPVKKSVRFNVFKRDGFVCQYCGANPPAAVLEIDHITPVARGGDNHIDNLLTSCFDCNRGKSGGLLSVAPETIAEKTAILAEKEEQLKAFNRMIAASKKRDRSIVRDVEAVFASAFPDRGFTPKFRMDIQTSFIPKLPGAEIIEAMELACYRKPDSPSDAVKYFCGICWNKIKGGGRYGSR